MKKIDVLVILFIIFASLFTLKDLFLPGFYTSHDGPHQIVRAYYYHELINNGHFPPRYVFGLNWGFGYPLFIFSYHMPWLIAEIFAKFGLTIIDSVKMTFLIGFILSGIFMYFYQRMLFGRIAAFVGSLIYLYSPFRFANIFVRSAIGDATALIFAPLSFWAFDLIRTSKKINFLYLIFFAISLTALLISHAMIFFFFFGSLVLYSLYHLIINKNKKNLFLSIILSLILFSFYSSYYLLPSLLERKFTKFSSIMNPLSTVTNFPSLSNLIYSPWGYGTVDAAFGPMSLSIGPVLIFIFLISLICVLYLLLKKKSLNKSKISYGLIFVLIFAFTIYLMRPISLYFWKTLSEYFIIDFNWRALNLTVFAASMLAGWLIFQLKSKKILAVVSAFTLIVLAFYTNRNHLRINQSLDWSVPFFLKLEKTTNSFEEYLPKWAATHFIKENSLKIVPSDRFSYEIVKESDNYYELQLNVKESGHITLNVSYYPGWYAYLNGKPIKIDYEQKGLIEIPLSPGRQHLIVKFRSTPLRNFSDLLSGTSLLISGIYLAKKKIYG